ncbi:hypothetical protein [Hymenobacter bucti]|uniref:Glycerophosphoryl diester phosphodiesterase membrane domain-containing protein n=1 Tax=Hymenobacter bucti TaxID=1844114 RepID=A0ABW4QPW3_9BACT
MQNTFTQPADFWQQRDFGKKISATFEFMGAHWRPLGRVLLYLTVPIALVQGILGAALQSQLLGAIRQATYSQSTGGGYLSGRFAMYSNLFQSPLYLLNNLLAMALHTVLILSVYGYLLCCVYPAQAGAPVTVADVWEVVKRQFISTFFSLYGVWIFIALGFLLLFIPGVYMGVVLSLFFVVKVLEGTGFGTTLNRCVSLTRGKWWSTFGLLAIMVLIIYFMFASVGMVAALFGGLRALLLSSGTASSPFLVVISAFSGLLSLLLYPPVLLAIAFQYFNLVELKEGVGLRLLVDKLGQADTLPEAQSSYFRPDEEGSY